MNEVTRNNLDKINDFLSNLVEDIFKVSMVSYLFFFLLDQAWKNFVSDFFDLNIILIIAISSGILAIILRQKEEVKKEERKFDYPLMITLGILAFFIMLSKTYELGLVSLLISFLSAAVVILLIYFISR